MPILSSTGAHGGARANASAVCVCCLRREPDLGVACSRCRDLARRRLADLLEMYALAEGELMPGKGGGGRSSGIGPGLRIDALDFVAGYDVLPRLESWERSWRAERGLSPQPGRGTNAGLPHPIRTLSGVHDFLAAHLTWAYSSSADVDEFHGDVGMLHAQAANAARIAMPRLVRVTCPTDRPTSAEHPDGRCGRSLLLRGTVELDGFIRCDDCQSSWPIRRLLLVAASDAESEVWVAEQDAALLFGIGRSTLRRWAKKELVQRHRGRFEVGSVRRYLAATMGGDTASGTGS